MNLVESLIFYALSKPHKVLHDRILGSPTRAVVADDVHPGTKHNGASVSPLYLLKKMKTKLIDPMYFGTKTSKFCFRIISFSSLESESSFESENSKINFDQARSTTLNSLLRALRAIYNISSDKREEFFADELLVSCILGMES